MPLNKVLHTPVSLLKGLDFNLVHSVDGKSLEQTIATVCADSRECTAEGLFVALPGLSSDGHNYIGAAVAAGCQTIVCNPKRVTKQQAIDFGATVIEVEDTARAYAAIAANYYDQPAQALKFIGITGTNGKTTVSYLLEHVLLQAGLTVGVIGTVNNRYTGKNGSTVTLPTGFTTPEAFLLQKVLRQMVDNGVDYVIMEVSSHALAQSRIGSIMFEAAAFTNLSRDHLDYHAEMADYFAAKSLLFSEHLRPNGSAVLPDAATGEDDGLWQRRLREICRKGGKKIIQWGCGRGQETQIQLDTFTTTLEKTEIVIKTASGRHTVCTPLVGRYNIDNILCVYGLCLASGIKETLICRALTTATGAPGRVERVTAGAAWDSKGPVVLVDYAHTPDALEKVLTMAAALPHGRLFGVFGCGGDRDKGKRPLMGEIAGKICDVAVVTDDNPRTEDPDQIVAQIIGGLQKTSMAGRDEAWLSARNAVERGFVVIRDRQMAIEAAIRAASAGDIVVIAGKGHEPYQLTRQGRRFFDDRLEAKKVLFSWTTELIAAAVKGRLFPDEAMPGLLGPIITDSRLESRDGVFVALKGENHDGHDFAGQAVKSGARCLVVEKKLTLPDVDVCQVVVDDAQVALGDLAAFRRRAIGKESNPVIIGLTGSCGKTTVKEMVFAILSRVWPAGPDHPTDCVLKTRGNFNNLIGLPLSLLPLDVGHRAAVLEMGMNLPGELRRLGEIAEPDISCITNIHGAHLLGLSSIEGVARAKEELFSATRQSAALIVNLDDMRIRQLSGKYHQRKITFAVQADLLGKPDIWASGVDMSTVAGGGGISFFLHHQEDSIPVHLAIAGEHNVANALCAAAIAVAAGAGLEHIANGLADFRPPDKRMEMLRSQSGFTIINDTYNANPASMAAGLKTLATVAERSSLCLVGDMLELGASAPRAHYDIGKLIAELAIDYVGVVGEFREDVVNGALEHGCQKDRVHAFGDKDAAVSWMREMVDRVRLGPGDAVLVKASRGLRFETIVAGIIKL